MNIKTPDFNKGMQSSTASLKSANSAGVQDPGVHLGENELL